MSLAHTISVINVQEDIICDYYISGKEVDNHVLQAGVFKLVMSNI
jgi:hypothetical protein